MQNNQLKPEIFAGQSANTKVKIPFVIKSGDDLGRVAAAYGVTPDKISDANGRPVYGCDPGTSVYINVWPDRGGNITYQALPGDDWGKIAERTGVNYNSLRESNKNMGESFDPQAAVRYNVRSISQAQGVAKQQTVSGYDKNYLESVAAQGQGYAHADVQHLEPNTGKAVEMLVKQLKAEGINVTLRVSRYYQK